MPRPFEQFPPVMRKAAFRESHQQMAITTEPPGIGRIEPNDECLDLVLGQTHRRIGPSKDSPERLTFGGFAVAVEVESDQTKMQRQLYGIGIEFGERRLGRCELLDERLNDSAC